MRFWCRTSSCYLCWGSLCSIWSWLWVSTQGEDLYTPWLLSAHCLKVEWIIVTKTWRTLLSLHSLYKCSHGCPLVLRGGHGISGNLLYHVHLLQPRHHLGPLLSLQLLSGSATMAELQQHLEYTKLYQSCHQQQLLLHSQPGVLQVRLFVWEKLEYVLKTKN